MNFSFAEALDDHNEIYMKTLFVVLSLFYYVMSRFTFSCKIVITRVNILKICHCYSLWDFAV